MGEGNQRGTDAVVREEGEGSPGSPGQPPPPPPKPAWSAAKPHRNATRSHDLRRTCNSLPSPGTPCAILYWRSYKGRHELLPSRSFPAPLRTAPALFGKKKPRPGPAFLFASSSGTPCPRSPPWRWDHGARFLPLPPPAAPDPAQLRLPLLQDDVSASQSGRAGPPRPARPLAAAPLPPPSWLGLRRGSLRSRSQGTSAGRGIGGEGKKKKTLYKKPTTKPTKTPAAISRNNRQNPSEQPQRSALRRERERERNKRHTHRRVRQEKKYP